MPQQLNGQVAVVTGGASGIGRATVELFLREGAEVLAVDSDEIALKKLAEGNKEKGLTTLRANVEDEGAAKAAIGDLIRKSGRIDILVAAAGYSPGLKVLETTLDDWRKTFTVNGEGTFLWLRECLAEMVKRKKGSIITISSQRARAGGRTSCAYVSSKGAILSLTMSVALDYAEYGIRCNAILPGAIETQMSQASLQRSPDPAAARARALARHPMGRFGQPDEVAHAALYLASDASSFVTGIELPIDGGWLAG